MNQALLWVIWAACLIGMVVMIPFGVAMYGREVRRDQEAHRGHLS